MDVLVKFTIYVRRNRLGPGSKSIEGGEEVEESVDETRTIDTMVKRVTDEMILRYKCDRKRTSRLGRGVFKLLDSRRLASVR